MKHVEIGADRRGEKKTYSPEALEVVEVDIVLGDLFENGEITLSLVQGANGGVAAKRRVLLAWILA